MKILVTGGGGQLARSVARRGGSHSIDAPSRGELDITDEPRVIERLRAAAPDVVINAAAYTAVDEAENDRERAFAVNETGASVVARACASRGVTLLHASTDYVFDGASTRPIREDDPVAPLGVYGTSKAAGEAAVLASGGTVVRTSWLFAAKGPSFVQKIVQLAAERPVLRIVDDQHGCPTFAEDLADALLALAAEPKRAAIYHYCNAGETTWYGFARAIVDEARRYRVLACEQIEAIRSAELAMPARRPAYAVLDTSRIDALGIARPHWNLGLARVIAEDLEGT